MATTIARTVLTKTEEFVPVLVEHLKNIIDKAEDFFPEVVENSKDKLIGAMSKGLDSLKAEYPLRHADVSQKWREIVTAIEPHLAPVSGGRRKRTIRRKKHRTSK
jgi:hypothetical protein